MTGVGEDQGDKLRTTSVVLVVGDDVGFTAEQLEVCRGRGAIEVSLGNWLDH